MLRSAVANAEANHGLHGDELLVSAAYVDGGPTIKRWRARARGRAARIRKRTCHITVRLAPAEQSGRGEKRKRTAPGKTQEAGPQAGTSEKPKRTSRRRKTEEATA